MDSALRLHRSALHIPSTTSRAAGLARPYSSFEPSSLSLFSKASTYPILSRHTFCSPVICALNKPSPPSPNYDKDNGKRIVIVVGGASVVLACVLGVINYNFNFIPTAIAGLGKNRSGLPTQEESAVGPIVNRPKDVLDSLLKVNRHLAKPKSKRRKIFPLSTPKLSIPPRPTPEECENFKIAIADLIKSGKCHEAETQLKTLCEDLQGGEVGNNVEMELVLVLIFQGKYEEASTRNCLNINAVPSDGRFHFYKAIIHTMLGENKDAEECWNNFVSSFSITLPNPLEGSREVQHPKQRRTLK